MVPVHIQLETSVLRKVLKRLEDDKARTVALLPKLRKLKVDQ